MPIEIIRIPVNKLIFPGEKLYSSRSEEEDAIQAIRMFRSPIKDPHAPKTIVGSDIFIIEDAIRSKLVDYSKMEAAASTAASASVGESAKFVRLPIVPRGAIRKMQKVII